MLVIALFTIGFVGLLGALVSEIAKARLPFTLNPVSCQAALTALAHPGTLRARVEMIVAERERMTSALERANGVTVYRSSANFILLRMSHADAVVSALVARGVLVRRLRGHPLLENTLRVSIGTPDQNDRFIAELARSMAVANE